VEGTKKTLQELGARGNTEKKREKDAEGLFRDRDSCGCVSAKRDSRSKMLVGSREKAQD